MTLKLNSACVTRPTQDTAQLGGGAGGEAGGAARGPGGLVALPAAPAACRLCVCVVCARAATRRPWQAIPRGSRGGTAARGASSALPPPPR